MEGIIEEIWPHLVATADIALSVTSSAHAILNKRDTRSAVGWVGLIWLVPFIGAVLYLLLGINRIKRRARALRSYRPPRSKPLSLPGSSNEEALPLPERFKALARLMGSIVEEPLLPGNNISPLIGGAEAYPAMLEAIDSATESIHLSTYIFDNDRAGELFHRALARAAARNVQVRVIIDAVGARYSWPPIISKLRRSGVSVSRFLPTFLPLRLLSMNLRNHRKLLVVDGKTGFTGGMNIRQSMIAEAKSGSAVQDIHFRIEGPVVAQFQKAFVEDWAFSTGEALDEELCFPPLEERGTAMARGIPDGPDEDFEKLHWTVYGGVATARRSVRIVTPYFLPDFTLITALNHAALRGVAVDIILPRINNLPVVGWASRDLWWQLLERGCRIWLTAGPFDHSKVMIVDDIWTLFGSGNWDPRSFRLNFEFNVECYDREFAGRLTDIVSEKMKDAHQVTLEEARNRPLPVRLRDGTARLFSPYL